MKLPQLSLRDLFWLVLVCAMGLGWWIDRTRLAGLYGNLIHYIQKDGGSVHRVEGGHRILWTR
jgi:hypothetical protein